MSFKQAEKNGISRKLYDLRIRRGWPKEKAMTEPPRKKDRPFTVKELAYICRFYDGDDIETMGLALDRKNYATIRQTYYRMKRTGEAEHYKQMWEAIG